MIGVLLVIVFFIIWLYVVIDLISNENYDGFVKTIGVILFIIQPWAIILYYMFANHKKKCDTKEVTE